MTHPYWAGAPYLARHAHAYSAEIEALGEYADAHRFPRHRGERP